MQAKAEQPRMGSWLGAQGSLGDGRLDQCRFPEVVVWVGTDAREEVANMSKGSTRKRL